MDRATGLLDGQGDVLAAGIAGGSLEARRARMARPERRVEWWSRRARPEASPAQDARVTAEHR
jgi:hypothetical protein